VTVQDGRAVVHVRPAGRTVVQLRPAGRERRAWRRLRLIRLLVACTLVLGFNYIAWRWLFSANWAAWPIAVPLLLAETYSFIDALLFGTTMWRSRSEGRRRRRRRARRSTSSSRRTTSPSRWS
jgi:hypothetical protein